MDSRNLTLTGLAAAVAFGWPGGFIHWPCRALSAEQQRRCGQDHGSRKDNKLAGFFHGGSA